MPVNELENKQENVNYGQYLENVLKYVDPTVDFHPTYLVDQDTFVTNNLQPSTKLLEGVPYCMDVEDAAGMLETERCYDIATTILGAPPQKGELKFSLMPIGWALEHSEQYLREEESSTVFVFTEYEGFGDLGIESPNVKTHKLSNPRTHTTASLNLYQTVDVVHTEPDAPRSTLADIDQEAASALSQELPGGGSLKVQRGGTFTEQQEAALWELFSQRFQDISDNMPVRLEEDEASTREYLFRNPDYLFIFTTSQEDAVDCCAFLTDTREAYPWISETFLDERNKEIIDEYGQSPYEVFVPGIAATRKTRPGASSAVLGKIAEVVAATNNPVHSVRFECTDVSSLYVPRLVQQAILDNPRYAESSMQKLGQKNYVLLEISAPPA